jgi:hypothetical protein
MAESATYRLMTSRRYRLLVVLAALALGGCPFNFRFHVENNANEAVAQAAGSAALFFPSPHFSVSPKRGPS